MYLDCAHSTGQNCLAKFLVVVFLNFAKFCSTHLTFNDLDFISQLTFRLANNG